ncbi:unnamed protein product [Toxocara canis]|uniref:C3H1-type domain-containing protein n=1 Tax=Toxocara canis TaxID=6265 RepID=A0A183V6Y5_TOXCA|nr:unnamed protein product [Toxocara canis]
MLFTQDNTGFSSVTPLNVDGGGSGSTSSRSSRSTTSGEPSFLTSTHRSLLGRGFPFVGNGLTLSSESSGNASNGSPPMPPPNEEGMSELLSQTADLFAVNTQSHSWPGKIPSDESVDRSGSGPRPKPLLGATTAHSKDPFRNAAFNLSAISNVNTCRIFERVSNQQLTKGSHHALPPTSGRKSPKPDSYKTVLFDRFIIVMCQAWLENNRCNFAENCRFAHGEEELRPCKIPIKNAKYKTKLCDKYTVTGLCPYGNRCLFIHPDADDHNAYIRPDRLAKMEHERQALASLQQQGSGVTAVATQQQTPLTSRPPLPPARAHRPPPSWPLEPPMFFHHIDDVQKIFSVSGITRTSENENYGTSPALSAGSLSSCSLGVSPDISERLLALGDITNRRASAYTISSASPFSELESADSAKGDSPAELASPKPQSETGVDLGWSTMDSDPFRLAIANDNLARHLATIFTHD